MYINSVHVWWNWIDGSTAGKQNEAQMFMLYAMMGWMGGGRMMHPIRHKQTKWETRQTKRHDNTQKSNATQGAKGGIGGDWDRGIST